MQPDCRNIYASARRTAGMTQERWSEAIGISTEAVRQYESGRITPSDEVVRRMVEVSMLQPLGYWHLCRKSGLAADLLPEVDRIPLSMAVLQLLLQLREFFDGGRLDELLRIAKDGRVDPAEAACYDEILVALSGIIQAALQVKFARADGEG